LNRISQIWFNQWKEERTIDANPLDWDKFKGAFLDRFFPFELRETKVQEFINLKQGIMSVNEYSLKFTQLSKYAPAMVVDSRACINRFSFGVSEMVVKEFRNNHLDQRDIYF